MKASDKTSALTRKSFILRAFVLLTAVFMILLSTSPGQALTFVPNASPTNKTVENTEFVAHVSTHMGNTVPVETTATITRCKKVSKSLSFPSSIKGYKVTGIGDRLGSNYTTEYVYLPDTIEHIDEYAFSSWHNLQYITLSRNLQYIYANAFAYTGLRSIDLPTSLTWIGEYAFTGCEELQSVILPYNLMYLSKSVFSNCKNLAYVSLPGRLKTISDNAFGYCYALTDITLPDGVTEIGEYAFSNCKNLKTIRIPSSVTSIGSNAFLGCHSLTAVVARGSYAERYCQQKKIPTRTSGW